MSQILIIEDDHSLNRGISLALKGQDRNIHSAYNLETASSQIKNIPFDLLILDLNLPDGNGLDFLRRLRAGANSIPVILLTANDMETDIVAGLESGADDYVTKPFSLAVLRARVNAQLRRTESRGEGAAVVLDGFSFDFDRMEFRRDGRLVDLSKTEQKLLRVLVENRGRTLPRELLVDRVWTDGAEYVDENALSVTVKRLRGKLEETPSKPRYLKTVYGIGYTWTTGEKEG